jgi:hypothetical protein
LKKIAFTCLPSLWTKGIWHTENVVKVLDESLVEQIVKAIEEYDDFVFSFLFYLIKRNTDMGRLADNFYLLVALIL